MFCKNCGNETENGKFCGVCGAAMGAPVVAKDPGKELGLISLILGIVCFAPIDNTVFSLAAIGAIIAGIVGIKKSAEAGFQNKLGKIGLVLSIVCLILDVLFVIAFFAFYILFILFKFVF